MTQCASVYGSRHGKGCAMGIIGLLEFHRTLAYLAEVYTVPVERDYWAY